MNFQQVKQANGQNVTMFGTFNEIGGVAYTQNQKPYCKCQIVDDSGEKHLVRLYNQNAPMPTLINMRQQFTLSSYQGQTQTGQPYTGYSGFWDDRAQVNQPTPQTAPPQAPYTAPQAPQQPAQRPNVPQPAQQGMKLPDTYAYPVTPETARRMSRTAFMVAMLQNGQTPLYSYVTEMVEYSYTGIEPMVEADNPEQTTTEGETCSVCGQDLSHCQCEPNFRG